MIRRVLSGSPIFVPDNVPIHHRTHYRLMRRWPEPSAEPVVQRGARTAG
jgi:hypothetical protein